VNIDLWIHADVLSETAARRHFAETVSEAAALRNDDLARVDHRQLIVRNIHRARIKRTERLDRAERALLSQNNLIKHNAAFVGRVRELTELRNALSKNKLGVVGARQGKTIGPVAVQGLGGMGKTELALAYAHAFAWDYPGGRWQIPCEYTADLRLALTRLAGPMHFEFTEEEKKDLALQFERVLREIQRRERCLLILDNVSDPHLLEPEYLDRLPRERYEQLYKLLCQSGVSVNRDGESFERLRQLRALYEGYATALSNYLYMPLPPWIAQKPHKDNWLTVARMRARSDEADLPLDQEVHANDSSQAVATILEDRHDF